MAQTHKERIFLLFHSKLIPKLNPMSHIERLFSQDKRQIEQEDMELRLDACRKFGKRYTRDMLILMGVIFIKRVAFEPFRGFHSFTEYIAIVAFFFVMMKAH